MLFFFPQGVFNETLNLIESVSEGFPSYSLMKKTLLILNIYYAKICLVLMSAFIQILTLIKKLKFSQTFYMITQIKFLVKISLLDRKKPKVRRPVNQNGSIKIVTKLSKRNKTNTNRLYFVRTRTKYNRIRQKAKRLFKMNEGKRLGSIANSKFWKSLKQCYN